METIRKLNREAISTGGNVGCTIQWWTSASKTFNYVGIVYQGKPKFISVLRNVPALLQKSANVIGKRIFVSTRWFAFVYASTCSSFFNFIVKFGQRSNFSQGRVWPLRLMVLKKAIRIPLNGFFVNGLGFRLINIEILISWNTKKDLVQLAPFGQIT